MTDIILTGLVKRRADLLKEAKCVEAGLRRLLTDIEHVDGAIRTYDPAYRPRKVVLRRAKRVDLVRTALDVLRQAKAPMTVREVTMAVMSRTGRDAADKKLIGKMIERVRVALLRQGKAGVVRSEQGPGQFVLWEVAR